MQITRRVYRGGEGEYLINGQICRLKDIKDLFLGSGAGNDAYCIIEQGRVDVLLQASTKDRRTIFEEAAGISRFKAKKIETLRKLERVDQNLQRLKDIIDEVEKQLRSVKLQAAKAQRYQEYSDRLKELRVGLGLQEYRRAQRTSWTAETAGPRAACAASWTSGRRGRGPGKPRRAAWKCCSPIWTTRCASRKVGLARVRQEIAAEETTLAHEGSLTSRSGDRAGPHAPPAGGVDHPARRPGRRPNQQAETELTAAETQAASQRLEVMTLEEDLQATVARLAELNQQVSADKNEHLEQMRRAAHLQNDAVGYKAQVDNLRRERERLRHRARRRPRPWPRSTWNCRS